MEYLQRSAVESCCLSQQMSANKKRKAVLGAFPRFKSVAERLRAFQLGFNVRLLFYGSNLVTHQNSITIRQNSNTPSTRGQIIVFRLVANVTFTSTEEAPNLLLEQTLLSLSCTSHQNVYPPLVWIQTLSSLGPVVRRALAKNCCYNMVADDGAGCR